MFIAAEMVPEYLLPICMLEAEAGASAHSKKNDREAKIPTFSNVK
jgi:hypothetical protein